MQVWVGAVAIFSTGLRWSRRDVLEAGRNEVAGGNPLLSAVAPRLCELFKFLKRALNRTPMRLYQSRIFANQRLDAD
jgi:hypothetical protein